MSQVCPIIDGHVFIRGHPNDLKTLECTFSTSLRELTENDFAKCVMFPLIC